MPEPNTTPPEIFDVRVYLGMILLRWQIITVCLLYGLLGGVVFLQVTPKKYVTFCRIMAYVDPMLKVPGYGTEWASVQRHAGMLKNDQARREAIKNLSAVWGPRLGDPRKLDLNFVLKFQGTRALNIEIRTDSPRYAEALIGETLRIHQQQWEEQHDDRGLAGEQQILKEMARLEEQIRSAEDDVIEFRRLNDIRRTELRAGLEDSRIAELVGKRNALETQMWMMEVMFPALKNQNVAVISDVDAFARALELPPVEDTRQGPVEGEAVAGGTAGAAVRVPGQAGAGSGTGANGADKTGAEGMPTWTDDGRGWMNARYRLADLRQQERDMAKDLTPEHPRLATIRRDIESLERMMKIQGELALWNMQDRFRAMQIMRDAVETAEYKWQAKDLIQMKRFSELGQLESRVTRLKTGYQTLYGRVQDIRLTRSIDAARFSAGSPRSTPKPIWPEPQKILLLALAIGLGSGAALAVLAQVFDNKIQSIRDVEQGLGIPFLGGIPFWAHSGLERSVRPIVTEEHSSGAVEAYRALRTSILAAMAKVNEKILLVTSADSREGKTLTSLNVAILIAQMGKKVLLVDMDLRRGRIHRSLGLEKEPGVTNILRDGGSLRSVIVKTRYDGLFLAPPGHSIEESPELLQSAGIDTLFVDVQDDYDYIIVDTSPVLRVTDSVIVASQGFGVVLLVSRINHTPKPLARYAITMLKDARIIGMVLNSIEMHKISSLYYAYQYPNYAYYSNAYSYGYSYAYYGDMAETEKRYGRRGWFSGARLQSLAKRARDTLLPME